MHRNLLCDIKGVFGALKQNNSLTGKSCLMQKFRFAIYNKNQTKTCNAMFAQSVCCSDCAKNVLISGISVLCVTEDYKFEELFVFIKMIFYHRM
jgi:hypothetical protein